MVRALQLNWRKEALYVTLVAAEMCWFTPWSLVIARQAVVPTPHSTALTLGILVLAVLHFGRLMDRLQFDLLYQRVILIVAVVITTALTIHSLLYPSYGWLDLGWLGRTGEALLSFYRLPPEVGISAIALFLWWRGISISQRDLTFQGVAFSFRLGVLLLIVSAPLLSFRVAYDATTFILLFFLFSLMAVALARVEEVSRAKGGVGAPFNLAWLAIVIGSIAAVLVVALLISRVYSIEGFARVLRWLQPVFDLLLRIIEYVLMLLFRLLTPLLQWFVTAIQRVFEALGRNMEGFEGLTPLTPPDLPEGEPVQPSRSLINALRYVCLGLIVAGILTSLALTLRKRQGDRRGGDETRESLWSSTNLADGILNSLRDRWDRLKDLAGMVERFGPGLRLYAAVSIRKIYANMSRLAASQGFPRQPAQTPYEYMPALGLAFPDCQAEATVITEAYVRVHYGELPESIRELQRIRECWRQIYSSYKDVKRDA